MVSTMRVIAEVNKGQQHVMLGTGSQISRIVADAYVLPIASLHKTKGERDYFTEIMQDRAKHVHNHICRQKKLYLDLNGGKKVKYGTAFEYSYFWEFGHAAGDAAEHGADLFTVVSRRDGTGWSKGAINALLRFTYLPHNTSYHDDEDKKQQNIIVIPLGSKPGFKKRTGAIINGVSIFLNISHEPLTIVLFAEKKLSELANGLAEQVRGIFRQNKSP